MIKMLISEEIYNKATKFAEDCVESNKDKYASRGQGSSNKIQNDIRNGKIAEELVYEYVSKKHNIFAPDYNIYDKSRKSYDSDIKGDGIRISVKSQDYLSECLYDSSFVFQAGTNDYDKEIFGDKKINTYVALVGLNVAKRTGVIKAIVTNNFLHENNLFKPVKVEGLQSNKLAVYFSDLEKFGEMFSI